jgi:hypothetical protein
MEPCEIYSDWRAKVECGSKHPIPPGGDINKVGMVGLTFELIANSLEDLEVTSNKRGPQHMLQNT